MTHIPAPRLKHRDQGQSLTPVVVLSLIVAIGFALGYGSSELLLKDEGPVPRGHTGPASNAAVDRNAGDKTAGSNAVSRPLTAPDPVAIDLLRTAIAKTPEQAIADPFDGEINGRVAESDGRGVPGVVIRARLASALPNRPDPSVETQDIEAYAQAIITRHRDRHRVEVVAESDADGNYRLVGLHTTAGYRVRATAEGYRFDASTRAAAYAGAELDFVATAQVTLEVDVRLPNGTQPEHATLMTTDRDSGSSQYRWSPGDPTIDLAVGDYTVAATLDEDYKSPESSVKLARDEQPSTLTLRLDPRPGIRGKITSSTPFASSLQVTVVWAPTLPGTAFDASVLTTAGSSAWVVRDDEQFKYRVPDIPNGTYMVGVERIRGRIEIGDVVTVDGAIVVHDFQLPPLQRADVIVVHVLNSRGEPIPECHVYLQTEPYVEGAEITAYAQDDGPQWLLPNDAALVAIEAPATKAIAVVNPAGFPGKRIELASVDRELTVRFSRPGFLNVTLSGSLPANDSGKVAVQLTPLADEGLANSPQGFGNYHAEAEDGTARVGPVEPGRYELTARIQSDGAHSRALVREVVDVFDGESAYTITLPPVYSATFEFAAFDKRRTLMAWPEGARGFDDQLYQHIGSGETSTTLDSVTPGRYTVCIGDEAANDMQAMDVTIRGNDRITFNGQSVNAIRVHVDSENGFLAKSGFRDGDIVVGIEDQEFENFAQLKIMAISFIGKDEVTVNVKRGTSKVPIKINPKAFQQGMRNPGGAIIPAVR